MAKRLDEELVARGLFETRSRARDAVLRGTVKVDGAAAAKPSQNIREGAVLSVDDPASAYVSRAALKLTHALDHFELSPKGFECLDVGASTGGFTQVLLERGARRVTALDVGQAQLHGSLISDPRVHRLEGVNARDLVLEQLPARPEFVVADVSFISLTLALEKPLALAMPGARIVALIKPQFEAGREALDGRGIVKSEEDRLAAAGKVASWLMSRGCRVLGITASPISGGDGNREFLIAAGTTR